MALPAVIFDMDGLLLDTERVCLECFVETRRSFSLSDSPETFLKCVGLQGERPDQIIRDSLAGKVSFDDFTREWDNRIDTSLEREIPLKPGVLTLLRALVDKGHSLAVATSTQSERACKHLEKAGLLRHFKTVVGGDKVERHKPDPETYFMAADRLGYPVESCIAFEDSETGTRAAIASRARTVQIPDLVAPTDQLIALGHLISPSLIEGAISVGLVSFEEVT